jgi:MFS family permease
MATKPAGKRMGPAPWVYSVLPVSLAAGPLGTLVQLHLVQLNGPTLGVIYAGLAVSAFNGVSIPASVFWGYASDWIRSRRAIIVFSYGTMAFVLLSLVFVSNTPGTILVYSVFGFMSAASATPLNLLIMESAPKGTWAGAFARLSMMSGVGYVGGLILSTVWAQALPIVLLAIPLGLCAMASAVLALVSIKEPGLLLERETIVRRQQSFSSWLLSIPLQFLKVPRLVDFRRVFRGLRFELTSYVPLFYISTVLFYLSSGIFNTSFVPALSAASLTDGQGFAVKLPARGSRRSPTATLRGTSPDIPWSPLRFRASFSGEAATR